MLSFLREKGDASIMHTPTPADPQMQPEGAGSGTSKEAQNQEYLTVAAKGKNVRKSTMLVAALFCIGLLCLWFMIRKSTPQTALASANDKDQTQIEVAIAQLTGANSEMFGRMDKIVKKFYEFSSVLQVQVNELTKNPFELELFLNPLSGTINAEPEDSVSEINAEMFRQQQIRQKAKQMQLKSIIKMQAEQSACCMIDDKILYEGDLINGFRVVRIGDNFVKLKWWDAEVDTMPSAIQSNHSDEQKIVLKLSE